MDDLHQNTELEATPSVKTGVSKILKESPGRPEHQAPDKWKRLEHEARGYRFLLEMIQVKRKFILLQTLMQKSTSRSFL